MTEIVIKAPAKTKPGFLRRVREVTRIQEALAKGPDVAAFDNMIDFVLKTCEVIVADGIDPRDALLDLSEDDYTAIMNSMRGADSAVPPQNGV